MPLLKLLSTDFDGTLIEVSSEDGICVPLLASELEKVYADGGFWAINTGRPLEALLEGLECFEAPLKPHYIITCERHIHYRYKDGSWRAFKEWNRVCDESHRELFEQSERFFEQLHALVEEYGEEVVIFRNAEGLPEELLASSEEQLNEIEVRLQCLENRPQEMFTQRSHVYLRFCHHFYNKGSVLKELSRFLGVASENVLAVGDYHNDLTMLNTHVAGMVACPANAHHAVKDAIQALGGHISPYLAGEGTADAIRRYRRGVK